MKEKKVEKNETLLTDNERRLIDLLKKGHSTVTGVSETFDIPKEDVFGFLDEMIKPVYEKAGYIIDLERESSKIFLKRQPVSTKIVELPKITSRTVKILLTSDWGFGLKTQQGDLIETVFREAEKENPGIWFSVVAGNFCAGKPLPGEINDYFLHTYDEQLDYLVEHFPKASFNSYIINSWRELKHKEVKTIGEALAERRSDIRCYGNHKASFLVNGIKIVVTHQGTDGSAYTISHNLQVAKEGYEDATEYVFIKDQNKPDILLMGGINTDFEIPNQTPFGGEKENDFLAQGIMSMHPATDWQLSKRGRKAMPFVVGYTILILDFDEKGNLVGEPKLDNRYLTAYIKKDNYLADIIPLKDLNEEEKKIIIALNEGSRSRGNLSSKVLGKSIPHVLKVIKKLQNNGYPIIWLEAEKRFTIEKPLKEKFQPIEIKIVKSVKTVALSDTHFGNENQRPDLLKKAYEIAEKAKAKRIFHCGDLLDGVDSHQFHNWELIQNKADTQRDYALRVWPKSKIPTYVIRGSAGHETVFLKMGYDIVDTLCQLARFRHRKKIYYLGGMNAVSNVNGIDFQLLHPKGGIPRGVSYRPQLLVENLVKIINKHSEEKVLLIGHLHVAGAMYYKGILAFLVPCLEDTTDYLKAGGHTSWLGMWIIEVFMDEYNNITRTIREYVPFLSRCEEQKKLKRSKITRSKKK